MCVCMLYVCVSRVHLTVLMASCGRRFKSGLVLLLVPSPTEIAPKFFFSTARDTLRRRKQKKTGCTLFYFSKVGKASEDLVKSSLARNQNWRNCLNVYIASASLDSRTATDCEPVISPRLCYPHLLVLTPLRSTHSVPQRTTTVAAVVAAKAVVVTGQSRMHACRCKRR